MIQEGEPESALSISQENSTSPDGRRSKSAAKTKAEEKDPKKLKKQEKEEKDFRKKFKVCYI